MVISHAHKFIWFSPQKTASTTIIYCLSQLLGDSDVICKMGPGLSHKLKQQGAAAGRNYSYLLRDLIKPSAIKKIALKRSLHRFYKHQSALSVRDSLGPDVWKKYTKISVFRSPLDVAISRYYWQQDRRGFGSFDSLNFGEFYTMFPDILNENRLVYAIGNESIIDEWLDFDNLSASINTLESKIPALNGLSERLEEVQWLGDIRPTASRDVEEFYQDFPEIKRWIEYSYGLVSGLPRL